MNMQKQSQKTSLQVCYEKLNTERKKHLLNSYKKEFNQKSEHRFYLVMREPRKLTALELHFFTSLLSVSASKILEKTLPVQKTDLAQKLNLTK